MKEKFKQRNSSNAIQATQFKQHCEGIQHQRNLRKEEEKKKDFTCKYCDGRDLKNEHDFIRHIQSRSHRLRKNYYLN